MTAPTAKNRKYIASMHVGRQSEPVPSAARQSDPAATFKRGIAARLRGMGLGMQTRPPKEMRLQMGLDMQVIYFTVRMPVAGGVTLRWPVMATFSPKVYSPTRAQRLS